MTDFSIATTLIVLLAGVLTGIINGVIGGGSLVSYVALTSTGLPPALSASTNTVGVMIGNPAALLSPLRRGEIQFKSWLPLAVITASGSVLGGVLLVSLPERIFEALIPVLLLIAGVSVWIRPRRSASKPFLFLPMLFSSGVYNGYFGPGQGILNLSILYRYRDYKPTTLVVLKNYIITLSNIAVACVFIISSKVMWSSVFLLWISVGLGGWLSNYLTTRLNEKILRMSLTLLAVTTSSYFLLS